MTIRYKRQPRNGAAVPTHRQKSGDTHRSSPEISNRDTRQRMLRIPQRSKRRGTPPSDNIDVESLSCPSAAHNERRAEHGALLPATIVSSQAQTPPSAGKVTASFGMTIGLSFCIVVLVSLTAIMVSSWMRKRTVRRRQLDCRKSPWTVRYRQEKEQYVSPSDVDGKHGEALPRFSDACFGAFRPQGYSKHGPTTYEHTAGHDEEASASRIMRKSDWLVKLSQTAQVKRRTNIQADPFSSPVLMPSMPQSVCASPRMRTMQQGEGHADVVRRASLLASPATTLRDEDPTFPSETQDIMSMARCSSQLEGRGDGDTTAVSADAIVGLGLLVGDGSVKVNGKQYGCSADMYTKWMPDTSNTSSTFVTTAYGDKSILPSSVTCSSIYTAASVASASCFLDEGETLPHASYASFSFLDRDAPPASTWCKPASQRQSSLPYTSPLLEEIFDEQNDARVTRNFVSAMRSIKRQVQHAPSEGDDTPSVRLSRRTSIRRRTRTSDCNVVRARSQDGAGLAITLARDSNDDMNIVRHTLPPAFKKSSSVSVRGSGPVRSSTIDVLPAGTARCTVGSPLKHSATSAADGRFASPRSTLRGGSVPRKSLLRRATPLPTSLQAIGRRIISQRQREESSHTHDADGNNATLITRQSVHRRSYSVDSCLSTAILSYLHTDPPSRASSIARSDVVNTFGAQAPGLPSAATLGKIEQGHVALDTIGGKAVNGSRLRKCNTCISVPSSRSTQPQRQQRRQSSFAVSDDRCDYDVWQKGGLHRLRSVDSFEYASPTMQVFAFYDTEVGNEPDVMSPVNVMDV